VPCRHSRTGEICSPHAYINREARFGGNAAGFDLTNWRHEPNEAPLGLNDAPSRLSATGTPAIE